MGRSPCCEKAHTNKGAWTKEEDQRLIDYIRVHGEGCWRSLPKAAGLLRCGKSCRLRWINYLRPDLKRGNFTEEEDEIIIKLHSLLGNKWSLIAGKLPGRTDNEIKNYWNTHIKRKLVSRGIDPQTHRPLNEKTTTTTTATSTTKTTQLNFKNTPPQSLAEISILKSQLDSKYNSTKSNDFLSSLYSSFKPKKIETASLEENNCTSCSTTTDEEQQQKRESHHDQDINLDLTIGLAPTTKGESTHTSSNSAESRLQQPVSSRQLFGSVSTGPGCLCWQSVGAGWESCRDCQNHRYYCWK
ncbi:hypothetical protein POPTR_019G081500v4 [Populus trichocarpa]|uniref:MYB family protein n=1 Tax=Populus trichocarpa TaxID=3694 RepID=B9IQH2_POPTR|nr:transcription factor MYB8 [Populus trichocarpa]PNS91110.1 hypothetical protein POPTR_019G081500v4 [Populus trichocarpa]|eukprot:XP_002325546.1 transcription factor MYB8 [Populus trichocarpa]